MVEQVINYCHDSSNLDSDYGDIAASTIGICFVGTSHHGAKAAECAAPTARLISTVRQANPLLWIF